VDDVVGRPGVPLRRRRAELVVTRRELQVLRLAAEGKTMAEIATELGISYKTVRAHLQNIYRALGVRNKTEAFIKMGWLMT
jgi:DNA-binding NarL/FixJ family response regulator